METTIDTLSQIPIFQQLTASELVSFLELVEEIKRPQGHVIFQEGQTADGLYILLEGRVEVRKQGLDPEHIDVLNTLEANTIFGEMALISDSNRSAEIRVVEDAHLLKLPKPAFQDLVEAKSVIAFKIVWELSRVVCDRLRSLNDELVRLVDLNSRRSSANLAEFAHFKQKILSGWSF